MKNVIVDLDGTLADDSQRAKMFLHQPCTANETSHQYCEVCNGQGKIHHWTPYFEACDKDLPNTRIITLTNILYNSGHKVLIVSGREASVHQKTLDWLDKYRILYDELHMRPIGNRVQDNELKLMLVKDLSPPHVTFIVLEDRQRVVDAWRDAGYTCLQVAPGKF